MKTIVPAAVDKDRGGSVDAAANTAFKVADNFLDHLPMFAIVFVGMHIKIDLFCKTQKAAPAEIFLVFEDHIMHIPEFTLEGCRFGCDGCVQRDRMKHRLGIMPEYKPEILAKPILQIFDDGIYICAVRTLEIRIEDQLDGSGQRSAIVVPILVKARFEHCHRFAFFTSYKAIPGALAMQLPNRAESCTNQSYICRMDYFARLLDLLKIERDEDRRLYRQLTETTSVSQRRAAGLSWYPIAIKDSEMTRGDYLTVEVERTSHADLPHQLRFGASAALFSNNDAANDRVEGTITHVNGNKLRITLLTDELPEWTRNGKLGIDLLFDDNSYDEMIQACKLANSMQDKKEGQLIRVLTGAAGSQPTFATELQRTPESSLNASQRAAVEKILSANDLAIVHGPPGTGKTTTLVEAIKALVKQEGGRQILVVAPSNAAVDLLSERLADQGLVVLRVGNPTRVSERLMSLTLDSRVSEHSAIKEIKRLKKQANEFRNMAHKYKRNFGKAERDQRKALFDEARKIMKEVENTEKFIVDDLLSKAQVITATLVGANHNSVRHLKYHTVIIDEAGQALEPACWIPIVKAQKLVLAGDPHQLPPTVKSQEATRAGLSTTLLEKAIRLHPESVTLLEEQYRMHETIMGYSSSVFYEDRLQAHPSVANHSLTPEEGPLLFIDTAGLGYEEKTEDTSTSNPEEAAFLIRHLGKLVQNLAETYSPGSFPSIAVISPYKQQVQTLKELYDHAPVLHPYRNRISVNTIDSFQGQERDIVYISMTRSNTESKIGFLSDIRRMNVAMTRARKKLVVIGDSGTLSQLPFYADFIAYADKKGAYQSAWEFIEE